MAASLSRARRSGVDRRAHLLEGAATADIGDGRVDVGIGGLGLVLEQRRHRHDHPALAVAALRHVVIEPGLLHLVQRAVLRQPLDRGDLPPRGRARRHRARAHRNAVDMDGAGAALGDAAAILGTGQSDRVAQHPQQRGVGIDIDLMGLSIHAEISHAPPPIGYRRFFLKYSYRSVKTSLPRAIRSESSLVLTLMPSINVLMPATSVRPNLSSLRSMSWMISAMARSAGSFNALRSSSTSNVHLSPSCVNSASNMSKRSSPSSGRYPLPDTNLNCASGSMKRRINQALAMRSTYTPCRVTQVLLRSVPNVLAPESTVALSVTASPSFNRASRFLIKPSAVSRPMAPKKSTETTSARRLRRRATCTRNSASAADFAFGRSDFANARASLTSSA